VSDTLWKTNDTLRQERLNRMAIIGRMAMPLYDVDNALAVTVTPVKAGVALDTTIGDIYAVASGIGAFVMTSITITNTDTATRTASVYLIEPGSSAASVARTIFNDTLYAGQSTTIRVPYILAATATIRGIASVTGVVSVSVSGLVYAAQPAGLTLKVVEGVALGTSLATIYTAPSRAILLAATLCNTDTAARTPALYIVPSGGSAQAANRVWSQALLAKETGIYEGLDVMASGDFIRASASTASVVSLRLSILEAA
jgi:hypothetical protein